MLEELPAWEDPLHPLDTLHTLDLLHPLDLLFPSRPRPGSADMRTLSRRLAAVAVVVLIGMQFVPVARTNPPVTADLVAPPEVRALLERACFDCHSRQTAWPWYAYVAPVSWLVESDVQEGREHLDFSGWGELSADRQAHMAEECVEMTSEGEMPLWFYVMLHPEAELTPADHAVLGEWSRSLGGARLELERPEGEEHGG